MRHGSSVFVSLARCLQLLPFLFCFPPTFFSHVVWLELLYWAASKYVPFIYRRLRREIGPSPSHCSLGAGWDAAATNPHWWSVSSHSCMHDLGWPPVAQSTGERSFQPGWDGSSILLDPTTARRFFLAPAATTSMASTTSLQRRAWRSSKYVHSFARLAFEVFWFPSHHFTSSFNYVRRTCTHIWPELLACTKCVTWTNHTYKIKNTHTHICKDMDTKWHTRT